MSSRVMDPAGPVPLRWLRSTPRSRASLRTGGLASARPPPFLSRTAVAVGPTLTGGAVAGAGAVGACLTAVAAAVGAIGVVFRARRLVAAVFTPYPTSTGWR